MDEKRELTERTLVNMGARVQLLHPTMESKWNRLTVSAALPLQARSAVRHVMRLRPDLSTSDVVLHKSSSAGQRHRRSLNMNGSHSSLVSPRQTFGRTYGRGKGRSYNTPAVLRFI